VVTCRYIHLVPPGGSREKELARFKAALELQWDYYGPFGFAAVLAEANEPMYAIDKKVDADLLLRKGVALFGTPAEVGEAILKVKEQCGYVDFMFHAWFESGGFSGEEIEAQMQLFAEDVTPGLARACGGQVKNPEIGVDYTGGRG
jgi:hypothetical protein